MKKQQIPFKLKSDFAPAGGQTDAIKNLLKNLKAGKNTQTLLGVTGSGKSLHYDEPITIKDTNGTIKRFPIGKYVESKLQNPRKIGNTEYQKIENSDKVLSFNTDNYKISDNPIVEISRHEEEIIYEIILDDNSKIKLTADHNCFRLEDCHLNLVETKKLKPGDHLPTSLKIMSPKKPLEKINLLEYIDNKLNISEILKAHAKDQRVIDFFKQEFKAPSWKMNQIINETSERGISISQTYNLLKILNIDLESCKTRLKIITKGEDVLSPIIEIDNDLMIFLGLYVAEGHNTGKYTLISNENKDLQNICKHMWGKLGLKHYRRNKNDVVYYSKVFSEFLACFGKNAHSKQVPDLIYNVSDSSLAYFLRAYFDGDGWVENCSVHALSASQKLIYQIKELLLRFEITSRISMKVVDNKNFYQLNISGKNNLTRFKNQIGFSIDYKMNKLNEYSCEKSNTNVDLFPNCEGFILKIRKKYGLTQKDVAKIMGCERSYISMIESGIRSPSITMFHNLAKWLYKKDKFYSYLLNILKFNFRKIVSIKKIRNDRKHVYDISVKNNENFVAGQGGLFVHNTFTMANVIKELNKPTLIIAHNKTLAAQLYEEFKSFFPENRVEYFISYYDYYQPESYLPAKDQYIEKDSAINPRIEMMRHATTASLRSRRDVIVIASVSCIYGLGNPKYYSSLGLDLSVGQKISRTELIRKLVENLYERNDTDLDWGRFKVTGDTIELIPGYMDNIIRIELFGSEIEQILELDRTTKEPTQKLDYFYIYPAKHYVVPESEYDRAIAEIEEQLKEDLGLIEDPLISHRLNQRTRFDIDMIKETGTCKGIENYSRHFDNRKSGEKSFCLLDYFGDDFLIMIDESHRTIPQINGMYNGDRARKKNLIDYGFRLTSAFDNRPLKFKEFEEYMKKNQTVFVSATPADYEYEKSGDVVEQIIRPTGLLDPEIEIRPIKKQVLDVEDEIREAIKNNTRVLLTTLTKRMAEEITDYLSEKGIKTRYLHSEIDAFERTEIIRELRLGEFDCLVGINLLREGLDIPEVGLVGILDADKEGFLRDAKSIIQTVGRAARNANAKVVLYADKMTGSIKEAIRETKRRREIQIEYNKKNNITPKTISKPIKEKLVEVRDTKHIPKAEIPNLIIQLESEMREAAELLDFERAIGLRNKIKELKKRIER